MSESNGRAIFNLALSEMLKLPYSCSVGRLPYRRFLYQEAKQRARAVAKLSVRQDPAVARLIESYYHEQVRAACVPGEDPLEVPPFLAGVLAKVAHAKEIPEALADMRRQAAPFRRRLTQMNELVLAGTVQRSGSDLGIDAMRAALRDEARLLRLRTLSKGLLKGIPLGAGGGRSEASCVRRAKSNTDSGASRTPIPAEAERRFRAARTP